MQRDFEELPGEQVPALRGKLLALTLHNARASPALRTQLCLALAALAVHLPASEWKVRPRPGRSPPQLCPKWTLLLGRPCVRSASTGEMFKPAARLCA